MIDFKREIKRAVHDAQTDDSHTERDSGTFHPSQCGMCKRQMYLGKLGLKDMTDAYGFFHSGTLIHEWLEDALNVGAVAHEMSVETTVEHEGRELVFTGHCDVYDPVESVVYDFKSRGGWHRFSPPKDSHLDQLHVYMKALGVERAQIVYINKKCTTDVRTWPPSQDAEWYESDEDETDYSQQQYIQFDEDRWQSILDRVSDVATTIELHGHDRHPPTDPEDIPFESCQDAGNGYCYPCDREVLDL